MNPGKKFCKRPSLIVAVTILALTLIAVPTTLALTERAGQKTNRQVEVEEKRVKGKPTVQIKSRFLLVPVDCNEITNFFKEENLELISISGEPNLTHYFLNSEQLDHFLALGPNIPDSEMLAAPKVLVFDGEEAELRVEKEIDYISGYTEPNMPFEEPEPKQDFVTTGTRFRVRPKIEADNKNILLWLNLEVSKLIGFEKRTYKGKYPYQIPMTEIININTSVLIPDGHTLLIGGQKIKNKDKQWDRIIQKDLLVLIKAEQIGKLDTIRSEQRKTTMRHPPVSKNIYKQLEGRVELSGLTPEMSFSNALEILKNSVEPPLQIVVLWRDLYDNADIDRTTPINIDAIPAVRLGMALELLLKSVSSGFAELDYVVKGGVIIIATKESLPSKLETNVYDATDVLGRPADYYSPPSTGRGSQRQRR